MAYFSDDDWLDGYPQLPEQFLRALDIGPRPTRLMVLQRVAGQLGINETLLRSEGEDLLWQVVDAIAERLEQGKPDVLDIYRDLTKSATDTVKDGDLVPVLIQLDRGSKEIGRGTTWFGLPDAARAALFDYLLVRVQRMMGRWERERRFEWHKPGRRSTAA